MESTAFKIDVIQIRHRVTKALKDHTECQIPKAKRKDSYQS